MKSLGVTPRVSVLIPCFNAAPWIRETLRSVTAQTGDLEVIAVDDGSSDGTAEIITREFRFVRLEQTLHRGASSARNLATSMATGEFIQYLDADDLLAPGKIAAQVMALEASRADVAYGDWQRLAPQAGGIFAEGQLVRRKMVRAPDLELLDEFWCPPAAYLFRRGIVDAMGGWNERLPVIQDARFALDCALHGAKFVYCPGVMAYYRDHAQDSLSKRDPAAFVRDIYNNALEVEESWRQSYGCLDQSRTQAVIKVLAYVARASYELDRPTFEAAVRHLERLSPGYVPDRPRGLAAVSNIVGYRRAEAVAHWYRLGKRSLRSGSPRLP